MELLSPAGDWESLRAAVANGADAVYFGLDAFNARARAHNFTREELPEVMAFLHKRNVKGFVAFNVLVFANEIEEAAKYIEAIAAAGVDAVIVQDLGLAKLIHEMAPTLPIHGSTQMTLTEPRGIEFVRQLGVERVVLARELSLEEIKKVTANTTMPVEVFVHGALCVAYSGQCLTSEALGGRSANRGQCAQACRLPYEMVVDGVVRDLGDKAYLLSPQDLAAYEWVKPLVDAGVISFKIEGRLKGGPYVAATTQTYRKAIDAAVDQSEFHLERSKERDLAQVFSRGFTPGFLEGNNHQRLVRGRFPKSRGVKVGVLVEKRMSFSGEWVCMIRPCESGPLRNGDGLLFDLGTPEVQEPAGRVWTVDWVEENHVWAVSFGPEFNGHQLALGVNVWKTDDPQLRKKLEQSYSQDKPARRVKLDITVSGTVGGLVTLVGHVSNVPDEEARWKRAPHQAIWPGPLEMASKRPTTHAEIREQLSRLGDTPFELGELTIDLPDGVMVPKSVLNDLRRRLVESFPKRTHVVVSRDPKGSAAAPAKTLPSGSRLTVLCRTMAQLDAALASRSDLVACDFEDLRNYKPAVEKANSVNIPIALAPLRIWKPGEDGFQTMVLKADPDYVLVRNLAGISFFHGHAKLIGDFSLNVANDFTAQILFDAGLERLTPSFDLNWEQFEALMTRNDPSRFEAVIHQHMPMFHMEHCVFAAFLSTGKDHRDCGRPCDTHRVELRDRVGAEFPVHPDTGCRNTVFNSVPQSAAEYIGRMQALGVRHFRIDLLRESPGEVKTLIERYRAVIDGRDDGRRTWRNLNALNQLGVTRGTMQLA